jgi:hypothetical protein
MNAVNERQALFTIEVAEVTSSVWGPWPLEPEAHIAAWQQYEAEARKCDAWTILQKRLVQLQIPIEPGISQTRLYQAVTRKGLPPHKAMLKGGLGLQKPEAINLFIHNSAAGLVPVIKTGSHADFALLIQAILFQNEPTPIPLSAGAYMITGYNNWGRLRDYRIRWAAQNPDNCSEAAWQAEFKRLLPEKYRYQDRFIILYDGSYSGVPAEAMELDDDEWRVLSLKIRLEHECTHYFTKRVLGVMRNHLFDELLADYAGIVAALGHFRADWFLRFMGMEAYPAYRDGGRLQNYLDSLPLQSIAFREVQAQLKAAAENLERFDQRLGEAYRTLERRAWALLTICCFTLPELAAESAPESLWEILQFLENQAVQVNQYQAGG